MRKKNITVEHQSPAQVEEVQAESAAEEV